jgi:hypothetical protein
MDEDLIKLVNKLQDTFSNLGARPRLALLSTLCSTLTPSCTMRGFYRRGAGHAPVGCGMQASCPLKIHVLFLFLSFRKVGSQSAGKSSVLEK